MRIKRKAGQRIRHVVVFFKSVFTINSNSLHGKVFFQTFKIGTLNSCGKFSQWVSSYANSYKRVRNPSRFSALSSFS